MIDFTSLVLGISIGMTILMVATLIDYKLGWGLWYKKKGN